MDPCPPAMTLLLQPWTHSCYRQLHKGEPSNYASWREEVPVRNCPSVWSGCCFQDRVHIQSIDAGFLLWNDIVLVSNSHPLLTCQNHLWIPLCRLRHSKFQCCSSGLSGFFFFTWIFSEDSRLNTLVWNPQIQNAAVYRCTFPSTG